MMFYTRNEISQITGYSPSTLSKLADRKEGPPCFAHAGLAAIRYPKEDADRWMNGEGCSFRSTWGGARSKAPMPVKKGRRTKKSEIEERERIDALGTSNDTAGGGAWVPE